MNSHFSALKSLYTSLADSFPSHKTKEVDSIFQTPAKIWKGLTAKKKCNALRISHNKIITEFSAALAKCPNFLKNKQFVKLIESSEENLHLYNLDFSLLMIAYRLPEELCKVTLAIDSKIGKSFKFDSLHNDEGWLAPQNSDSFSKQAFDWFPELLSVQNSSNSIPYVPQHKQPEAFEYLRNQSKGLKIQLGKSIKSELDELTRMFISILVLLLNNMATAIKGTTEASSTESEESNRRDELIFPSSEVSDIDKKNR